MRVRSISFLLVLVSVAVFAGPAQSDSSIECGSLLTESVTLDHDIGPCPQGAFAVVGGDVTIDLNGHTITGSGGGTGVLITTPADGTAANVSVTNGSVSGFGIGVGILVAKPDSGCGAAGKIAVEDVGIRANQTGVSIFGFPGCPTAITLSRDNITGNAGDGVAAAIVGPVSVLKSHIVKNGGVGIRAAFDSVRRIDGNLVAHNGADGVRVEDSVASITNNRMSQNGGVGLWIRDTISGLIPRYVVADNVADGNGLGGMTAGSFPDPPTGPAGENNTAKHNGLFQCVLIVCAPNRGRATTEH